MSRDVAVIGAGAAGLVAARELRREGHKVVVFERGQRVGGTWVYEPEPCRRTRRIAGGHSSLYHALRTNLPRELMGFLDYPFGGGRGRGGGEGRDSRRFPGHGEVLQYLEDFLREFGLEEEGVIRLGTEVLEVELAASGNKWRVRWRGVGRDDACTSDEIEVYDAVVVCSGHYTQPNVADIPGVDVWPGKQIHSKNYRVPEPFQDQVVVLIGNSASAFDISREVSKVAKEVHVSSRSAPDGPIIKQQPGYDNMWLHSMIVSANEDGTVVFQDGSSVLADIILHCTGYKYHFPFLKIASIVTVDDNRVGPLYKHVFPPSHAPWLSFIGLPKLIPFPLFELQSKWVAGALSGRFPLPSEEEMLEDVNALYKRLDAIGHPKRHTHTLTYCQFEYTDWLATECGCAGIEEWRKQMFEATKANKKVRPESYRDEWEDHHLIAQAQADFVRYLHRLY